MSDPPVMGLWFVAAPTLVFLGICVASDVRTLRIPNRVTGPAMLIGFLLNGWVGGWPGALNSLSGLTLAIVVLLAPFALGGIGAGDVKMMGAVGALLGPKLAMQGLFVGILLGGVFATVHLLRHSRFREKLSAMRHMLVNAVLTRSTEPLRLSASSPTAVVLPYSVPLGIGTVAAIALSVMAA